MGWGVGMVGNKDFELSYKIAKATLSPNYNLKHFICINTATCIDWAINGEQPLIQAMDSITDFESLGFDDEDWARFITIKPLEFLNDFDYEGVYVMRIA